MTRRPFSTLSLTLTTLGVFAGVLGVPLAALVCMPDLANLKSSGSDEFGDSFRQAFQAVGFGLVTRFLAVVLALAGLIGVISLIKPATERHDERHDTESKDDVLRL